MVQVARERFEIVTTLNGLPAAALDYHRTTVMLTTIIASDAKCNAYYPYTYLFIG